MTAARQKYKILLTEYAEEDLRGIERRFARQIARKIDTLADDPRPPASKKLKGAGGIYRLRSSDFRILYEIDDKTRTVTIARIGDRKDIYG